MQVSSAAHRPGRGTLRHLLMAAVLVGFGLGGALCVDAPADARVDLTVTLVAAASSVALARRMRRVGGQRAAFRPRRDSRTIGRSPTVPLLASSPRGHPGSRRGPPWGASHPATCA